MKKILIIGLGLIGGSFAKALREHKIAKEIFAFDLEQNSIDLAKNQKIIDDSCFLDDELNDFDLIVIASPLASYQEIFQTLSKNNISKPLIIDLGSVKEFVLKTLPKNLLNNFIACHPIAGSEKQGFENSDENLFQNKKFIICSEEKNKNAKIIFDLVKKIGANPEFIDAKIHDEIFALVSHLPQFLSFLTRENSPQNLENSFMQTAFRLDESEGGIWSDIFKINEKNIEKFYLEFFDNLEKFVALLKKYELEELIGELKKIKLDNKINVKTSDLKKSDLAKILFRVLIVASFLRIKKIDSFKSHAGSGFKDFTSIINLLELDENFLIESLKNSKKEILNLAAKLN